MTQFNAAIDLAKWASTGAVGAGGAWALGILLGRTFLGYDISDGPGFPILYSLYGGAWGLFVGVIAGWLLLKPAHLAVAYWGFVLGFTTTLGTVLSEIAIINFAGVLPSQVSSSLGFAVGGVFAGLCGYVWFRWIGEPRTVEPQIEEEEVGPLPSEGKASVPTAPNPLRFASFVRSLPIFVAALSSPVVAVWVSTSDATLGLFVGLFGLSVTISLWDQEQRLRTLERLDRSDREP